MSIPAIGSVLSPSQFQIQSAENQVILSWQPAPLATIYYVSRSDDGITFAELGTTTTLQYIDTTGTVNTVYYYYIQSGDGTYSSRSEEHTSELQSH